MHTNAQPLPILYFDGACPVCSREIEMYRRQPGAEAVQWVDASTCSVAELGPGLMRGAALGRMHLRMPDGQLVSGAVAFTELWKALPRWTKLGRVLSVAPVLWALELGYRLFLTLRPLWRPAP